MVAQADAAVRRERENVRAEGAPVGWDAMERIWESGKHLQGYCLRVNATDAGYCRGYRGPSQTPPDPQAARQRWMHRTPWHQARCKACGKYGHEEARCKFLVMFLWCGKYMMNKTEEKVNLVFEHWCKRNKKHPSYDKIKATVRNRGISSRKITAQMIWEHFSPMLKDEYTTVPVGVAQAWDNDPDEE